MAYHHGDLRGSMLAAAAASVEESGVAALSLRELARRVGVTHTAPRHHFGDKRGLVTALAVQGYRELTRRLRSPDVERDFLEAGVAYVRFALEHPGHYQVMFHPEVVDRQDPQLSQALTDLAEALVLGSSQWSRDPAPPSPPAGPAEDDPVGAVQELPATAVAAWSLVHGFATLALADNFSVPAGSERIEALCAQARATLVHLSPR